jgi:flagellar hook-length control protein FliK
VSEAGAEGVDLDALAALAGAEGGGANEPADAVDGAPGGAETPTPAVSQRPDARGEGVEPAAAREERSRDNADHPGSGEAADAALQVAVGDAQAPAAATEQSPANPATHTIDPNTFTTAGLTGGRSQVVQTGTVTPSVQPVPDVVPAEVRFAEANTETIVRSVRAELLPNGGSMRIKLDPPQLGALNVTVQIRDGVITAAFETSSEEATRLLGHSLNQLKSALESQGIGIDKLHVQQAPKSTAADHQPDAQQHREHEGRREQDHAAQQEQQRREMLRRMWRRIAGGHDPLDLTA